jgi:hypothetical protein
MIVILKVVVSYNIVREDQLIQQMHILKLLCAVNIFLVISFMKDPYHPIEGQDAPGNGYINHGYDESYHQQVRISETSFSTPEIKVRPNS